MKACASKIDVIITCYNKQNTIARAIKSVQAQTFEDFSAFVVDDGSTDKSREVILEAIKDDKRFTYIRIANAGVANARNTGISYGQSLYVACLDGDDAMQTKFLETCYNGIAADRSIGVAYTDMLLYHADGFFTVARWRESDHNAQFILNKNGKRQNQVPCCNLFRRDVFERLGGYRQRYAPKGAGAEDADLWRRFFDAGYKAVKVSNEPLLIYSTFTGLTQQGNYEEVDWLAWRNQTPFASLQSPQNGIMHPVREYDRPAISVVIPVGPEHNHFLVDALDSLEAQTFSNWEAIVVLDGETYEDGINTIDLLKNAYPYVRVFTIGTDKPMGAGYARNFGAKYTRGKYLCFLDVDDYLQAQFLEFTYAAMEKFKPSWVYTDCYGQTINTLVNYNAHVATLKTHHEKIVTHKNGSIEYLWHEPLSDFDTDKLWTDGLAAVTCLYNKADFWEIGGFNEQDNREDWELQLQLARAGKCGLHIPLPLLTYRQNAGFRREYKHYTNDVAERQQLKKNDALRLHTQYNKEELRMACSSCGKRAVPPTAGTVTVNTKIMEYAAEKPTQAGTIYVGKATGKRYPVAKYRGKLVIFNVDSNDAKVNPIAGLFKPYQEAVTQQKILIAATPKKVEVQEVIPESKIEQVENEESAVSSPWYESPEAYTIPQLKKLVKKHNLETWEIETMLEFERMGGNRKGVVSYLMGLLK